MQLFPLFIRIKSGENNFKGILKMSEDSRLVSEILSGNIGAFRQLVESYKSQVYNLAYRLLGDCAEAEDAAQETFLRAFKSLHSYDHNRPFASWLLSITHHYCIDLLRKRRAQASAVKQMAEDLRVNRGRGNSLEVEVRELLDKLGEEDRAVVVLKYWYGYDYREISEITGLSESAVKSRLYRARRTLAEEWLKSTRPKAEG
ncbi:MAG TPA: RNA polymerase sigma factor [Chloroflexi bacterium]|nr:RNA polymerase sigma factor [Chloroflexota bacterium]